jgi:GNAT superfamily N-acetyltransferase
MIFADRELSQRLERAEGFSCAEFAEARRRQCPESRSEWIECGGAFAVFDGVDSPITQTFGLGLFQDLNETVLDEIERFLLERNSPVLHEVSPFAGVDALDLLCRRNYRPIELSSVLYQPIADAVEPNQQRIGKICANGVTVREIEPEEATLWSEISTCGWSHDHPELAGMMQELSGITVARKQTACFLAEADGQPGAAGVLCIHEGVAVFGGAATVPELRKRGLQTALLAARMQYAFNAGCDLAMMVALPGSESQRNAERAGFRIAYTRTKWRLSA